MNFRRPGGALKAGSRVPNRRGFLVATGQVLGVLVVAGWAAPAPEIPNRPLAPEFQLFLDAQAAICEHCVYRPAPREVVVGCLKSLFARLGGTFAPYYPSTIPQDLTAALDLYEDVLRRVAASPKAREAKWTTAALVERSLQAYCQSLDPYSHYTDAATATRLAAARHADYVGIGVTIRLLSTGYQCAPFRGGAASLAGVCLGDELLEIEGANVRDLSLLEVTERLGGAPGSSVRLRVRHRDGREETLRATREAIASTPLVVEREGARTRVSLTRINARALEDLHVLLQSLGPERELTLDLRGCEGGTLAEAVRIAEQFLPEKTPIATLEMARGKEVFLSQNRAPYRPKALRILQDEGTASGAELIIAALCGYAPLKAISQGEKTFGKGVTQQQIRLPRGGILVISDTHMFGPNEEFWDRLGLPPTEELAP